MPDPTLTDALAEAYASAPASATLIHTLSITFDGMLVGGAPGEIYVFQGYSGDRENADGVPLKDFRLEATAAYRAGQVTEFVGIPFDVVPPAISNAGVAKGKLVIDGVGREITDLVRGATAVATPILVTYRAYLEGLELAGPQNLPPMQFSLQQIRANATQVSGEISVPNLSLKKFPRQIFRKQQFPSLRS